jgi:hypothetical protein
MALAPSSTYFNVGDGSVIGQFTELSNGNYFEYSENRDENGWGAEKKNELPHKIWVTQPLYSSNGHCLDSGFRYGKVRKTVVYIAVDESTDGSPVFEKWSVKQRSHQVYDGKGNYAVYA